MAWKCPKCGGPWTGRSGRSSLLCRGCWLQEKAAQPEVVNRCAPMEVDGWEETANSPEPGVWMPSGSRKRVKNRDKWGRLVKPE